MIRRMIIGGLTGLFIGIVVDIMFAGVPIMFIIACIALGIGIEQFLLMVEKDSATKRAMRKILTIVVIFTAFIGFRVAAGQILNMPLINTFDALSSGAGAWILVMPSWPGSQQDLILELMLVVPGLAFALGIIQGGAKTKSTMFIIWILMFIIVVFQVKQARLAQAVQRSGQAKVEEIATDLNLRSLESEKNAKMRFAVMQEDFGELKRGTKVFLASDQFDRVADSEELMIKVTPERNGLFKGERVLVPYRKLEIVASTKREEEIGQKPPPLKKQGYKELYSFTSDGQRWSSQNKFTKGEKLIITIEVEPVAFDIGDGQPKQYQPGTYESEVTRSGPYTFIGKKGGRIKISS